MEDAPKRYTTYCTEAKSGREIFTREFEALSDREAEDRAFLNCVKLGGDRSSIEVKVKRVH